MLKECECRLVRLVVVKVGCLPLVRHPHTTVLLGRGRRCLRWHFGRRGAPRGAVLCPEGEPLNCRGLRWTRVAEQAWSGSGSGLKLGLGFGFGLGVGLGLGLGSGLGLGLGLGWV